MGGGLYLHLEFLKKRKMTMDRLLKPPVRHFFQEGWIVIAVIFRTVIGYSIFASLVLWQFLQSYRRRLLK